MIRVLVAAMHSGAGKTTLTCSLLSLLKRKGLDPCAFKCGPDYIDPMFHRSALGIPSHNLDLYLSEESYVRHSYARYSAGRGACVTEGVMGYYDGVGATAEASASHLAKVLDLPVLLTVYPSETEDFVDTVRNFIAKEETKHIAALFLNPCGPDEYRRLAPVLEQALGLPVVGYLPHLPEAQIPSRHLGLQTAGELAGLQRILDCLTDTLAETLDWKRFAAVFAGENKPSCSAEADVTFEEADVAKDNANGPVLPVRIGVAYDNAFCFLYPETLDAFREAGAEPVFFSPLQDSHLPEGLSGLYIPGGYPELHVKELSANTALKAGLADSIARGMPTIAECGGFLYLGTALSDPDGNAFAMAGVLPGSAENAGKPVRFGYAELTAKTDGLLLNAGESVPVHSFHYWDTTETGTDLHAVKPVSGRNWDTGFQTATLFAAFEHIYYAGHPALLKTFIEKARYYFHE